MVFRAKIVFVTSHVSDETPSILKSQLRKKLRREAHSGESEAVRDAVATARALPATPAYFIDADPAPQPDALPVGGLTVIDFPNNHLVYALTWFALAAMVAGAYIIVMRQSRRP